MEPQEMRLIEPKKNSPLYAKLIAWFFGFVMMTLSLATLVLILLVAGKGLYLAFLWALSL